MIWTLYVCIGVSWAGCGEVHRVPMPDKEICMEILSTMHIDNNKGENIAYCYPFQG